MGLNQRIRSLRNEKGMTQKELSKILEIGESTLAHYERGDRQPDYKTLDRIARFFNVTADYLLERTDQKNVYDNQNPDYYLEWAYSIALEHIDFSKRLKETETFKSFEEAIEIISEFNRFIQAKETLTEAVENNPNIDRDYVAFRKMSDATAKLDGIRLSILLEKTVEDLKSLTEKEQEILEGFSTSLFQKHMQELQKTHGLLKEFSEDEKIDIKLATSILKMQQRDEEKEDSSGPS